MKLTKTNINTSSTVFTKMNLSTKENTKNNFLPNRKLSQKANKINYNYSNTQYNNADTVNESCKKDQQLDLNHKKATSEFVISTNKQKEFPSHTRASTDININNNIESPKLPKNSIYNKSNLMHKSTMMESNKSKVYLQSEKDFSIDQSHNKNLMTNYIHLIPEYQKDSSNSINQNLNKNIKMNSKSNITLNSYNENETYTREEIDSFLDKNLNKTNIIIRNENNSNNAITKDAVKLRHDKNRKPSLNNSIKRISLQAQQKIANFVPKNINPGLVKYQTNSNINFNSNFRPSIMKKPNQDNRSTLKGSKMNSIIKSLTKIENPSINRHISDTSGFFGDVNEESKEELNNSKSTDKTNNVENSKLYYGKRDFDLIAEEDNDVQSTKRMKSKKQNAEIKKKEKNNTVNSFFTDNNSHHNYLMTDPDIREKEYKENALKANLTHTENRNKNTFKAKETEDSSRSKPTLSNISNILLQDSTTKNTKIYANLKKKLAQKFQPRNKNQKKLIFYDQKIEEAYIKNGERMKDIEETYKEIKQSKGNYTPFLVENILDYFKKYNPVKLAELMNKKTKIDTYDIISHVKETQGVVGKFDFDDMYKKYSAKVGFIDLNQNNIKSIR